MRRYVKTTGDEAKILAAINSYMPAVQAFSWALLLPSGDRSPSGTYYKISGLKVAHSVWADILTRNGIVMAGHFRASYRGSGKTKYFGECLIKSRFGETKVERYLSGGIRNCDNAEALVFFQGQYEQSVKSIVGLLDGGDLEAAKAEKRRQISSGEYV